MLKTLSFKLSKPVYSTTTTLRRRACVVYLSFYKTNATIVLGAHTDTQLKSLPVQKL